LACCGTLPRQPAPVESPQNQAATADDPERGAPSTTIGQQRNERNRHDWPQEARTDDDADWPPALERRKVIGNDRHTIRRNHRGTHTSEKATGEERPVVPGRNRSEDAAAHQQQPSQAHSSSTVRVGHGTDEERGDCPGQIDRGRELAGRGDGSVKCACQCDQKRSKHQCSGTNEKCSGGEQGDEQCRRGSGWRHTRPRAACAIATWPCAGL